MKKDKNGYFRHDIWYEGKSYAVRSKSERELWKKVAAKEEQLKTGQTPTKIPAFPYGWRIILKHTKKPSVTERTYSHLKSLSKKHICSAIGNMRIKDVRQVDLQRILNACEGSSASHVNKLRNLIKGAFTQAHRNKMIYDNPADGLKTPNTTEGTNRPVTDTERQHLLNVAETHRGGLWVLIMLYKTSMRQMWESFRRAMDISMGAETYKRGIIPETSQVAKDLTPYCLRHTFCTDLQTAGVPINVAKDLMVHMNITMTARIYTSLSNEALQAAAERMEQLQTGKNQFVFVANPSPNSSPNKKRHSRASYTVILFFISESPMDHQLFKTINREIYSLFIILCNF